MPLVNLDDRSVWDELYSGGFVRENKERIFGRDHFALKTCLGLRPDQHILLVGAAFGWVAEDWAADGLDVTAIDCSRWIQANKAQQARVAILDENCLTSESRARLGRFDIIITEDVLPVLSDGECRDLITALRLMSRDVVHWITPGSPTGNQETRLNWKTLEQWKEFVSPDRVVQRGTGLVL